MRQLIIARKDLNMTPGKLVAQVSRFLTTKLRSSTQRQSVADEAGNTKSYKITIDIDK